MDNVSHFALICLGSNADSVFGNPQETVERAIALIGEMSDESCQISSLYRTPAFPAGAGPDFVNAAMAIRTTLSPEATLGHLHQIETLAGRVRTKRWGQRTLDLDLIAVDDLICPDIHVYNQWRNLPSAAQQVKAPDRLILPHPRLQDRSFVLVPLADVASGWIHPVLGLTVQQMLAQRPDAERAEVIALI
ncbi:2-amino-4-hydroxy-6-hydroxymethyldihydropteridine diphosphokinase [Yoonia sp.]|uniref:2-amino-4-hydroxy-6- hydroxymethyldihydropteridine diphosphokinase n=1 Tax=Yoonia sp. TaxID=2212373 RepID=UPI0019FFA117|nr:2-amino-4-hydroxy-6-hydroxymethyldihydropteridine diphosphokinase [Yoonia sp.]MBE0413372.1 2-amino-4-hydroxy-6-hydroxymethyldihydropteridine diphosphokinase [Yoonia sp.]